MKRIILFFLLLSFSVINAQSSWKKTSSKSTNSNTKYALNNRTPKKYDVYSLDDTNFITEIETNQTISLPNINGELSEFGIKKCSSFTQPVSSEYGNISSYTLKGIDDKTASGKISVGSDGVHVIVFSSKHSTLYIDPYAQDKSSYIAYQKSNLNTDEGFTCLVDDEPELITKSKISTLQKITNDGLFRTYKLALACTGEYAQFHINRAGLSNASSDTAKRAAVLSAMNTTITRVNGIFEREFAVTMEIVLNNSGENELIFLDSETDNLSNDNANNLIDESTDICDSVVGSSNYDIGHTFSTGAGGLAYLGGVCNSSIKGGGVTGSSFPVGDSYDIDFVAHEIGHQFGANHTFNSSSNGCDGNNRSNSTAAEPGSGSTIMAYAGLCSPHNIQNNSDDYFHVISTTQILNTIQSTSCATTSSSGNTAPTVNAGIDVSVPKSTPLVLQGTASDINNDPLTYCWEQIDVEIASMPPISTNTAGPAFRSLPPTDSPYRYLPTLSTVINGSTENEWEVIPSVAREMNFALNVRDNNENGGAITRDDIKISIIDTNPFVITSQNTSNTLWKAGSTETITWDKSTTDQAPINCENVKIMLSTNGGESFDITLTESTPNDGTFDVIVPNEVTTTARIIILAVDNIFYNVNAINFEIESNEPNYIITNNSEAQSTCMSNALSVEYSFDIEFINGFNETITLDTQNLPTGVTANFSHNEITSNQTVTLTLLNFGNALINDYAIQVLASSTSISNSLELPTLSVESSDLGTTSLSTPANNSSGMSVQSTQLTWDTSNSSATSYTIEIATDENFNNVVISEQNLTNNFYNISQILDWSTQYFWRIKPSNFCADGNFTNPFSFTTDNEEYCPSTFNNYFDEFISNVTFNNIDNDSERDNDDGYEDFTSISTQLALGETYPLSITLDPLGFQDHCYVFIDWNGDSIFNTTDERYDFGNHFGNATTVTQAITVPVNTSLGDKRMRVIIEYFDNENPFGTGACDTDHNSQEFGETEDYTLIVVDEILDTITDGVFSNFSLYPNPLTKDKSLVLKFKKAYPSEKVSINIFNFNGKLIKRYENDDSTATFFSSVGQLDFSNLNSGLYFLVITNGDKTSTRKLIIE